MENTAELVHWGIKGMRWGVRRYQNKDGSLTPAGRKRYGDGDDSDGKPKKTEAETREETRARLLKSTNAQELYKNRDLLTTAEMQERLNRIDTEARLGKIAESTKKTGMDYVDKALSVGRKVSEVYDFLQKPMFKDLAKKLGLEEEVKYLNPEQVLKKRDTMDGKKLADYAKRFEDLGKIEKYDEGQKNKAKKAQEAAAKAEAERKAAKEAKKEKEREARQQEKADAEEAKKQWKQMDAQEKESKAAAKAAQKKAWEDAKEAGKVFTGTVFGEGKSKYTPKDDGPIIDVWDYADLTSSPRGVKLISEGSSYMKTMADILDDVEIVDDWW